MGSTQHRHNRTNLKQHINRSTLFTRSLAQTRTPDLNLTSTVECNHTSRTNNSSRRAIQRLVGLRRRLTYTMLLHSRQLHRTITFVLTRQARSFRLVGRYPDTNQELSRTIRLPKGAHHFRVPVHRVRRLVTRFKFFPRLNGGTTNSMLKRNFTNLFRRHFQYQVRRRHTTTLRHTVRHVRRSTQAGVIKRIGTSQRTIRIIQSTRISSLNFHHR